MNIRYRRFIIMISFIIIMYLSACKSNADTNKYEETQVKMDTVMTIKAYGTGSESAVKDVFKRINDIEQLMSLNIDSSEVNKINMAAGKQYVQVHPEVFKLIKKSIEYSKLSSGAFDITIGPVLKLWNFGTKDARVPSDQEIKSKLSLVGYEKIRINEKNSSVMLENEGMIIDLGGIAKGYAADEAVAILTKYGITKAIVNLGGSSVYVIGKKDINTPWSIGLQHPRKGQGEGFLGILKEEDKSVSTSGDYERFLIKDGKRYHHILDPATGYPADNGIISDTIIIDGSVDNSSMDADALSTILFVLGPEKGMNLIKSISKTECIVATSDNMLLVTPGVKDKIVSISEEFKYDAQGR